MLDRYWFITKRGWLLGEGSDFRNVLSDGERWRVVSGENECHL